VAQEEDKTPWNMESQGTTVLKPGRDFHIRADGKEIVALPDSDMLTTFDRLKPGFKSLDFSLTSDTAFAAESITKTVQAKKPVQLEKGQTKGKIIQDQTSLQSSYVIDQDITVKTDYRESKNKQLGGFAPVKQTITLENKSTQDRVIDFSTKTIISGDEVIWDGQVYPIMTEPQSFKAYAKTATIPEIAQELPDQTGTEGVEAFKNYTHTYQAGSALTFDADGHPALYDWTDALPFDPEIRVYQEAGHNILEFAVKRVSVPGKGETVIDPAFGLNDTSSYDIRYDGSSTIPGLTNSNSTNRSPNLRIGDVNGDGIKDLVIGTYQASYNGVNSGSAFVVFGGSGIAVGNKPFDIATNYNIRYDGGAAGDNLTYSGALQIGDVNGDSLPDLVLGAYNASNNGASSGSAWVMFSTLIDDVGATTGNTKPLSTGTNYNIRYDGGAANNNLTIYGALQIGDVNGDSLPDLVLGAYNASNNGASSGSAWVMFSTLIDDVGATTGNTKPLSTGTNYNIRYDGGAAGDFLTIYGALQIGDVNGDSLPDLVLGTYNASNNGASSGSAWVMFSTLIDDVGATTGNTKPLSTGTNYNIRYDGGAAGDNLTYSSTLQIGDVNGDSLPDLVLGAYNASNNGASSGSAWVMFSTLIDDVGVTTDNNKPLSTGTNYNIRYDGGAANDNLTTYGALQIGDVNGDSLPDLVLGAYGADNNGASSGSAWVMFSTLIDDVGATTGNNKPLSTGTNYNIRYDGGAANDNLTIYSALQIGDVNGDSLPDLVLGAYGADNNGASSGSAWVMFSTLIDDVGATTGNNKPLSTGTNYNIRYDGGAANDNLTIYGALQIGDVNGDSLPDLVLGAYGADNNGVSSGSAWVMFSTLIDDVGATTGNNKPLSTGTNYNIRYDGSTTISNLTGSGGSNRPPNLQIGDVNGDGIKDLVIGAYQSSYNGVNSGSAFVVFGGSGIAVGNKPFDIATNYNIRYDGGAANDNLTAYGALQIGDVNGDSLPDLVLGAYGASNNGASSGSAWVMFSTLIDDVGATTGNNKPLSTGTNYNIRYDGGAANNNLTIYGVLQIGDVNGDSLPDLVLGAYGASNNGASSGSAWVMFSTLIDDVGATTGNNKPLSTGTNYNIRYDGGAANDNLTIYSALQIGDVNGDSLPDLVLGAYNASNNGASSGSAWVMFSTLIDDVGATTGNNKPLSTGTNYNIRYDGGAANDNLTIYGALQIGDVNGDSLPDLVLGAYGADNNGVSSGSAWVMFSTLIDDVGATTGNNKPLSTGTNYNIRYDGGAASDFLTAYSALQIGDVNGDSLPDLVLGTYNAINNGASSGSAWVMFSTLIDDVGATTGNTKPLSTGTNYNIRYDGGAANDFLTYNGALQIGDVNGDSLPDLVLGAYNASNNGASSGSAWVMFSTLIDDVGATTGNNKPLSTGTNYNIRYDGGAAGDFLTAYGALQIGDVNGDSLPDLVLGAYAADNNGANSGSAYVVFGGSNITTVPDSYFRGTLNLQGPASLH
jgi:hypothetical protein